MRWRALLGRLKTRDAIYRGLSIAFAVLLCSLLLVLRRMVPGLSHQEARLVAGVTFGLA
jgi:hypothetical protein